ncbi:MAG: segregation/condensation protein A [Tenericutes bacterium]|nr:MAG: segregation/condensation protein A [Mycoplasmatota bacterium]
MIENSHEQDLKLSNFNGPFDLLLKLVRDKQMDILSLDLVELANAYIKLIEILKDKEDMDTASEYLVMSATLLQLKAKIVLQNPNDDEEVKAEKEDILKKLVELHKYRTLAKELKSRSLERLKFHDKEVSDLNQFQFEFDETHLTGKSNPVQLIMQLRKMFERQRANELRHTTIETINLSPAERRIELIEILKKHAKPTFEQIFSVPTISHFVITMLTILDMSRKQELIIKQNAQFDEITFERGKINE